MARDLHSHAEPERVRVRHVELDLDLDFDVRAASGTAELRLERTDPAAPLVLDAAGLEIEAVRAADGAPRDFTLGEEVAALGAPLRVALAPDDTSVTIAYRAAGSGALQWLAPEQTAGGEHPFLFSQGQAILTRTWIPLQDSPGVRVTYGATLRCPAGFTPVMSAEQLGEDGDGAFRFRMPQAIPPYLIALACGELAFRSFSERSGVWAEPSVVDAAHDELRDTEDMIRAAEGLFGAYRWGRYDVLVLPPAFPFGGMENPRLTFATPTILAGDRSLVSLVAHELAHSWSGNLVTNATWRDFWLNEGFTVYFEQRIMEEVFGRERSAMEQVLARRALEREMADLAPEDQVLHVDLEGRAPEEGCTLVPYEKGALFLRRLEELFGRGRFDRFLAGWFDGHAFESVTTAEFVAYLRRELLDGSPEVAANLDLEAWLSEPGLPADAPVATSDALDRVDAARAAFLAGDGGVETGAWTTQEWLHFVEGVPADAGAAALDKLDAAFGFTASGNAEILCAWLRLAIRARYAAADARVESFLFEVGRLKFLRPLYAALLELDAARARELYARARPRYHAVSTSALDRLLG